MKQFWDVWGWYSVLKRIADSSLFQNEGKSKMAAAKGANFWEAMTWLAQETHLDTFRG